MIDGTIFDEHELSSMDQNSVKNVKLAVDLEPSTLIPSGSTSGE